MTKETMTLEEREWRANRAGVPIEGPKREAAGHVDGAIQTDVGRLGERRPAAHGRCPPLHAGLCVDGVQPVVAGKRLLRADIDGPVREGRRRRRDVEADVCAAAMLWGLGSDDMRGASSTELPAPRLLRSSRGAF